MRVKIATNPPLPPVRAWFPLVQPCETISGLKSLLCTSISAFHDISPSSLYLSIDGFELLDDSELTVVRDGDLISVDTRDVPPARPRRRFPIAVRDAALLNKRKRSPSTTPSDTSTSSESESDSETTSDSDSSKSEPESTAKVSNERAQAPVQKPQPCVPPGHGKPQTQARNLRRRRKRMYARDVASVPAPVSGANAIDAEGDGPALMSLSLRNKNKAKNFKSFMNRPLPPKIIFGDVSTPRLIPPSSRSSLPSNVFVTSVDVEAVEVENVEVEVLPSNVFATSVVVETVEEDVSLEARWDTLDKLTREKQSTVVARKAFGIDPDTFTPGEVLTVLRVESWESDGLVVRPMRAVSFNWSGDAESEFYTWETIEDGDWKVVQ